MGLSPNKFKAVSEMGKDATEKLTKKGSKALGTAFNIGMPLYFGATEYQQARSEGNGVLVSGARAVGDYAMGEMLGFWGYMGLAAVGTIPKAAAGAVQGLNTMSRNMNRAAVSGPFANARFNDTQQAYTMRQAGMQLAQASKYNLQQTLMGNEAQYMKY